MKKKVYVVFDLEKDGTTKKRISRVMLNVEAVDDGSVELTEQEVIAELVRRAPIKEVFEAHIQLVKDDSNYNCKRMSIEFPTKGNWVDAVEVSHENGAREDIRVRAIRTTGGVAEYEVEFDAGEGKKVIQTYDDYNCSPWGDQIIIKGNEKDLKWKEA